jgi:hypothetical protein
MLIIPIVSAETINIGDYVVGIKQNECFNIPYDCDNCTFVNITIIVPNGTIPVDNVGMSSTSGFLYNYSFCDTSNLGRYFVSYHYDSDGIYLDSDMDWFQVTPNGEEATMGKAVFYIGLLIILVIFLIGSVVLFINYDHLLVKVGMLGIGYLLLMAITFISWNMASDFLLSAPFLVSMLRISFIVLMVGFFPLIIGLFIWYFLMLFKIKEIERLMTKGLDFNEAERRTGRKFR